MNVLLAEDDAVTRYILQEMLRAFGYQVTACADGRQAWEAFRQGDFRLVISDWMMPEMDGIELCRKIRASGKAQYCYFILQTLNKESFGSLYDLSGVDSYLFKPFDGDDLRARLKTAEKVLALESRVQSLLDIMALCDCCQQSICETERRQTSARSSGSGAEAVEHFLESRLQSAAHKEKRSA